MSKSKVDASGVLVPTCDFIISNLANGAAGKRKHRDMHESVVLLQNCAFSLSADTAGEFQFCPL
jgi:hypothetical protein